jgi:endoglucanase
MNNINDFLLSLLSAPGLSGFEEPIYKIIKDQWLPLADEISSSRLGSLHALRKSAEAGKSPNLLIAAHMDTIGLMVTQIDDGFLRITAVGGVDPRILPGQAVTVHGRKDIPGIVQMLPHRLLPDDAAGKAPSFDTLFIDTGLRPGELETSVRIGDIISFAQEPLQMGSGYLAGHSLDNRISVGALTVCLQELLNFNLKWNVWCVATVQEEVNMSGAFTSAYEIRPDMAIAVDVTFAKGPGSTDHRTFALGKGPSLGVGANIHPALYRQFKQTAEEMDMPYAVETMPFSSGTDSMAKQITTQGIPNMVLGIPVRYMHTPVELTAINDILRTGRLLARFITKLETDSLDRWTAGQFS